MIFKIEINKEYHPNGTLAYVETIGILSAPTAHLYPNRRENEAGTCLTAAAQKAALKKKVKEMADKEAVIKAMQARAEAWSKAIAAAKTVEIERQKRLPAVVQPVPAAMQLIANLASQLKPGWWYGGNFLSAWVRGGFLQPCPADVYAAKRASGLSWSDFKEYAKQAA